MVRLVLLTALLYGCMLIGGVASAFHDEDLPNCQPDNWGWIVAAPFGDTVIFYLTEEMAQPGKEIDPSKIFCILHPENPVLIMSPSKDVNVPQTFNQESLIPVSRKKDR